MLIQITSPESGTIYWNVPDDFATRLGNLSEEAFAVVRHRLSGLLDVRASMLLTAFGLGDQHVRMLELIEKADMELLDEMGILNARRT
jgi:hypothetical protein